MMSIKVRKGLTDEWQARGVTKEKEYAILTDEMTKAWSGLSVREYKEHKGLKKESLRDNMTDLELILNMLAEATTTRLSQIAQPTTFMDNRDIAREGGSVAKNARLDIESRTGQPVISSQNATDKTALEVAPSEIKQIASADTSEDETDTDDDE